MPDRIGRLTPLEESTMNVLWTVGTPLTVAEVHAKLDYPTAVMLVTVNRTLRRLHDAGYAQRTTLGTAAYAYSPAVPYAEHLGQVVASALNRSPNKHLTVTLGLSGAGYGYLADLLADPRNNQVDRAARGPCSWRISRAAPATVPLPACLAATLCARLVTRTLVWRYEGAQPFRGWRTAEGWLRCHLGAIAAARRSRLVARAHKSR